MIFLTVKENDFAVATFFVIMTDLFTVTKYLLRVGNVRYESIRMHDIYSENVN